MNNFEIPLDIPDIQIENVERNNVGDFIITVTSTIEGTNCRKCGRKTTKFYGYGKEITLRHLPILGHKVYIKIRPKRYQCRDCDGDPTTTQELSWHIRKSPHTKAYENYVLLELVNSTVWDVSVKEDIGYKSVEGVIERRIRKKINWDDIDSLDTIGIDEISLKKGRKDFVTVITGMNGDHKAVLGVLKGREKDMIKEFLLSIPKRLRLTVKSICTDMYDGYINAAKEIFKKDTIVIADRFHVAKLYRKSLDDLRKREMRRLKKELPEKEYKKLKGAMWALRKDELNLTVEEREILRVLFKYSPILKEAYELCDDLTYIFNQKISKAKAMREIETWMELVDFLGMDCFDTFLKTLNKYLNEITNYFINRQTSGFVEGLNNKIKVIKRRCYGILNINHLFQRIYLDLTGYSLFAQI